MLQSEFDKLTGIVHFYDEYSYANEVYNLVYMDKFKFCNDWKRHGDSEVIAELVRRIKSLKEQVEKLYKSLP